MTFEPRPDGLPEPLAGASLVSAQQIYREVFAGYRTYFQPFREVVKCRAILPRTHGYQLSQLQFDALAVAALLIHEDDAYLCKTEGQRSVTDNPECWMIKLSDYAAYRSKFIPLMEESLFLSLTGKWAVFISQEWFAVAAGPSVFITAITNSLHIGSQAIVDFILDNSDGCRDISRLPWLEELITHVYGQDEGWRLLTLAGFAESRERPGPVPPENSIREDGQDSAE